MDNILDKYSQGKWTYFIHQLGVIYDHPQKVLRKSTQDPSQKGLPAYGSLNWAGQEGQGEYLGGGGGGRYAHGGN